MVGGKRILAALTAGVVCSVAVGLTLHPDPPSRMGRFPSSSSGPIAPAASWDIMASNAEPSLLSVVPVESTTPARPVFRHSVVPGGVYSRAEVEEAMFRMPEVGEHYRGVNIRNLAPAQVSRDGMYYASYKRNGVIFWTSYRLRVGSEETVLGDGKSLVRARCGNLLSEEPLLPILPPALEPPPVEMSSVELLPLPPIIVPTQAPSFWIPIIPIIPIIIFSGGGDNHGGGSDTPPDPVIPEPAPAALIVLGLIALAAGKLLSERRKHAAARSRR